MPPKGPVIGKRKAVSTLVTVHKRVAIKPSEDIPTHSDPAVSEKYGIVQREFYPAEMSNARAQRYRDGLIPRPLEVLEAARHDTAAARQAMPVRDVVVHWFKMDLRLQDNTALHFAAEQAQAARVPLICVYLVSPQDYQAHLRAPVRIDFMFRTLEVMKRDLAALDIPLHVETVAERKAVPARLMELAERWGAGHIYANIEYEVDELRREAGLTRACLARKIAFNTFHDACVVAPGELASLSGSQYAVYTPWFRAWLAFCHSHPTQLDLYDAPARNPDTARLRFGDVFATSMPDVPDNKRLTDEEKTRFGALWPPGEHEARARLETFLREKVAGYKDSRNFPGANTTAVLSMHLAAGTLSARTAIRRAQEVNTTAKLDGGNPGVTHWISEVAWRDFYRHVLAHWPMNKPFKPEYTNIAWSYDLDHFQRWCDGQTGYPLVDAGMRQIKATGYCHNRSRMVVASFLCKHLLIDWRMGERYFMEHLVDGDFSSNNGGWGFAASVGVDPQPYFRIFNPLLQSEKFDGAGDYIRKWVPELRDMPPGKAIHDPYGRGEGKRAQHAGYPRQMVEHKFARDRCLAVFKAGIGRDKP
ncbi:MAG: hypothetical protein M1826_000207 [Phylliscum demangeonii]|nr:MAG: hypothetical protein M1826_000207 [Phylliscum demangeonii]